MSHDKGTNVSRETSRGAGEGEGFAKAGGTPRMPPQPRHPSHRPTTFLPPPRRPLSRNRPHRRSAAWTTPEHPAIAPATSRQRPHNTSPLPRPRSASPAPLGPTAPRPPHADARHLAGDTPQRERAVSRRRRPRSARRLASSSPAASQHLAAAPASQRLVPADARHFASDAPAAPSASRYLVSSGPDAARIGRRADARPRGVRLARAGLSRT